MILSVGEILVDIFDDGKDCTMFAGGAPFNMAANAKLCGARTGFVGRVGNDDEGDFLQDFAQKLNFDYLNLARDSFRRTTQAVVTVDEKGERSFKFNRNNTADYQLEIADIPLNQLDEDDIIHIGSLMLSTNEGRAFSHKLIDEVKIRNMILSFDVNLREDLFPSQAEAVKAYSEIFETADILKFSQEEITYFAQTNVFADAISRFIKPERLLVITLGKDGSLYVMDGKSVLVPGANVEKVVDTTGAGDAFMAGLLYKLDERNWRGEGEKFFGEALRFANALGAFCIQHKGAINKF